MRRFYVCLAIGSLLSLNGCGGGGAGGQTSGNGATGSGPLVVSWPNRSAFTGGPARARSLEFQVTSQGANSASVRLDFDRVQDGAYRASYPIPSTIPDGPIFVYGRFFSGPKETGPLVGSAGFYAHLASGTITLDKNSQPLAAIVLRTTADLAADPYPGQMEVNDGQAVIGTPLQVTGFILDQSSDVVVLPAGVFKYSAQYWSNDSITLDQTGILQASNYGDGRAVVSMSWGSYYGGSNVTINFPPSGNYHLIPADLGGIAYDPQAARIYTTNHVIDPATSRVIGSIPIPGGVSYPWLSLSTDGSTLYAGGVQSNLIQMVDAKSLKLMSPLGLGTDPTGAQSTLVAMYPLPNQPNSILAQLDQTYNSQFVVFDNGVARPVTAQWESLIGFCIDPSGQYCYGGDTQRLYRFAIDSQGVHQLNVWPVVSSGNLYAADGHVFDDAGNVFDATTGKLLAQFFGNVFTPQYNDAIVYPRFHQILFLGWQDAPIYDTRTLVQVGSFNGPLIQSFTGRDKRSDSVCVFGTHGLAIEGNGTMVLVDDITKPLPPDLKTLTQKSTGRR